MLFQLLLYCALVPGAAPEPPLQLAVVFDSSILGRVPHKAEDDHPPNLLLDLVALEDGLHGHDVDLAFVDCVRDLGQTRARVHTDFGSKGPRTSLVGRLSELAKQRQRCMLNADVIGTAVSQLQWQARSKQRILVISHEQQAIRNGRQTLEDVMRNAEHSGIVVHGLSLSGEAGSSAAQNIMRDIKAFVKSPTAPNGRSARHMRQGVLITGGSYYVSIDMPPKALQSSIYVRVFGSPRTTHDYAFAVSMRLSTQDRKESPAPSVEEIRAKLSKDLGIEAAYAAGRQQGLDALDKLAKGEIRPSKITQRQLPKFLHGHDLEPLLDPVWDFVNARRAIQQIITSASVGLAAKGVVPPLAGHALAKDILGPPHLAPSKR